MAELGRSIEEMRLAVLEQMKRENEAILANSRLITSLSHDLRTPLTKLMGYLDILRLDRCRDEEQRAEYLRRASDKALQMRALSDEMFRHFQVGDPPEPEEGKEMVSGPVFLGQLLCDNALIWWRRAFPRNRRCWRGTTNFTFGLRKSAGCLTTCSPI